MLQPTWLLAAMHWSVFLLSRTRWYSTLQRRSLLLSQYRNIKVQYPNHILLFQVGDFYEILDSDAELVASKTTLRTSFRNNTLLAGFPVKSLIEWQRTLIEAGFQLAICNQSSERTENSGRLFGREVVQLVTPGTLLEPQGQYANYLLAIKPGPDECSGLAWLELSTSEFKVTTTVYDKIDEHIERLTPSEVIISEELAQLVQAPPTSRHTSLSSSVLSLYKSSVLRDCHVTTVPNNWFHEKHTFKTSTELQNLLSTFENKSFSVLEQQAAIAILNYTGHTHCQTIPYIQPPTQFSHDSHMTIDANTRRSLEITIPQYNNTKASTLLGCIDSTVTSGGARLIKNRLTAPLTKAEDIKRRLDVVEFFYTRPWDTEQLRNMLRSCSDLERLLQKVAMGNATLTDLISINTTLTITNNIFDFLKDSQLSHGTLKVELGIGIQQYTELTQELTSAICKGDYGNYIQDGYSAEVDALRGKMRKNEKRVKNLADKIMTDYQLTKVIISSHKVYFRVFETTRTQAKIIDANPSNLKRVDQTQVAVRYTTLELQELNYEYQELSEQYNNLKKDTLCHLCNKVLQKINELLSTANSLSRLDVATTMAHIALLKGYTRPNIVDDESVFRVEGGYHPVLADLQDTTFIRNNCVMDNHCVWIITGPNMGGKSTFLRQNALIVILAQMGSFVPADSATIGVVDRLYARIGASDNVVKHISTFYMEMKETAHIISSATSKSFVILDEIGRGTATCEGLAIAQSVLEYIHNNIGCRALLATHFHELTKLSVELSNIGCYQVVAFKNENDDLIMTHKVEPGHTKSSLGLEIAELAGIPNVIVTRSKYLLRKDHT